MASERDPSPLEAFGGPPSLQVCDEVAGSNQGFRSGAHLSPSTGTRKPSTCISGPSSLRRSTWKGSQIETQRRPHTHSALPPEKQTSRHLVEYEAGDMQTIVLCANTMHESGWPLRANSKSAKPNFSGSVLDWGGSKGDAECSPPSPGRSAHLSALPFSGSAGKPNPSCADRCPVGALPMPRPGPLWCSPPPMGQVKQTPCFVWWQV